MLVNFAKDEDYKRRLKHAEERNSGFAKNKLDLSFDEDDPENNDNDNVKRKNKIIPSAIFKKMIAKDVNEMINDKHAGDTFLEKVQQIKIDRHKRNMKAMIVNSLDPNRKEINFKQTNIDDFDDGKKREKIEQK